MYAQEKIQEEIIETGSLFTITLFQEKLMRNFLLISNKLKKLQGLTELQQRNRALEKELRFVNMKVDTLIQKLPKQPSSINRNDVRTISKDLFFQLLNSNDEKLVKSKYHSQIQTEIAQLKEQVTKATKNQYSYNPDYQSNKTEKNNGSNVIFNFTVEQAARGRQNERQRKNFEATKENLKKVLDPDEQEILNSIMDSKPEKKRNRPTDKNQQLVSRLEKLQKEVEELKLGSGYAGFLQKQIQNLRRNAQVEQKLILTSRKTREKYYELQRGKKEKEKGREEVEISKKGLYLQIQKKDIRRQSISKEQATQRSTIMKSALGKERNVEKDQKLQLSNQIKEILEKKREKDEESFRRTNSIIKLNPIQKRLKIDDFKELNNMLRSIEVKIQSKISHDIYLGFVKDFEEKLQVIKLSRDTASEINELRKNIFALQSKLYSVIEYLQTLTKEDDGLIVKKKWACISCDKNIENYEGKIGQHLNWETVSAKKMSPSKVAGFGQTGQFATKVRNLIEGSDAE